jgi:2-polyprenyl-3-methyl-5-hydroxy-6-metoxy-1,4-benzoquinol methylase
VIHRPFAQGSREQLQAAEYEFPYHWIPTRRAGGAWDSTRRLEWGYEYLATLDAVAEAVVALTPERVLDFGCGDGRLACALAERGIGHVVGVDLSPAAIHFAAGFALACSPPPDFRCVPVADLVVDRPFSVCVALEVLEHIPDDEVRPTVAELHRLVAPGGHLVVSVPTRLRPVHAKHYRHYDVHQLVAELEPYFSLRTAAYIHRVGPVATFLRRLCHNRVADLASERWLGTVSSLYRARVLEATPATGAHLIATFGRCEGTEG